MMRSILFALSLALCAPAFAVETAGSDVPLENFFRHPEFNSASLSPDGKHLAVTIPQGNKTLLAVVRVSDRKVIGSWEYGSDRHIGGVIWVTSERIAYRVGFKAGSWDLQRLSGSLYASNIDGKRRKEVPSGSTYQVIGPVKDEPGSLWVQRSVEQAFLFKLNTFTGKVVPQALAPLAMGGFLLDHDDQLRYAVGMTDDHQTYRTLRREGDDWVTVHEQPVGAGGMRRPLGFASDNKRVYFLVSDRGEPARLVLVDPETGDETLVSRNENVEPSGFLETSDERDFLAVQYQDGYPTWDLIAPDHPETALLAGLLQAFPDHALQFANMSDDGNRILFRVYSDVDPGSYYMFDRTTGQATYLLASMNWIKPEQMARVQPVSFEARDGLKLHGYLALPNGLEPKDLPMVLWVHGGPHGPRDIWTFDPHAQAMASRGYAVFQVNFRGSGGYGEHFERIGYKKWGTTMQDDLTDAVRWIAAQGIVDPDRVCIYGVSYGGYAALMSAVREPQLYRCTIGYAGVYSLPGFFRWGDVQESAFGRSYLERVMPDTEAERQAQSPGYNVDKIEIPVALVHGVKDIRVPIQQYNFLRDRLESAGIKPEFTVLERDEGHGFYDVEANVELYEKIIDFLDRHTALRD